MTWLRTHNAHDALQIGVNAFQLTLCREENFYQKVLIKNHRFTEHSYFLSTCFHARLFVFVSLFLTRERRERMPPEGGKQRGPRYSRVSSLQGEKSLLQDGPISNKAGICFL